VPAAILNPSTRYDGFRKEAFEMTSITAELQIRTVEELIQRRRVARLIVVGSASFTALIAIVGAALAVAA
jgi:hypothetical protein